LNQSIKYSEGELLPISALQHILFCERQYALIHIEQVWAENMYTAQGTVLHKRIDAVHHESRGNNKSEYGLAIRSLEYGLIGKADVVEFVKVGDGYSLIKPVEYKRGHKKQENWDNVQLCAQALCLEEMFNLRIFEGEIYYLQNHRRTTVFFDDELREETLSIIERGFEIRKSGRTPLVFYQSKKCDRCSLLDLCMSKVFNPKSQDVSLYIHNQSIITGEPTD